MNDDDLLIQTPLGDGGSDRGDATSTPSGEPPPSIGAVIEGLQKAGQGFVDLSTKGRWSPLRPMYGFDLDEDPGRPFHPKDNGYGPFGTLAGFSLAQGATLAAAAKGQDQDWVVLGLYAFAVALSASAIVLLLRAEKPADDAENATAGSGRQLRAFDRHQFDSAAGPYPGPSYWPRS